MPVATIDVNFFEGQARTRFTNKDVLGPIPYVVATDRFPKIVTLNSAAKNCGLSRDTKLRNAKFNVPNLQVIDIPLYEDGSPDERILDEAEMDFKELVLYTRDYRNWDIPIETKSGSRDEVFLDLTNQVDNFISENPRPYIDSNELHWNSYFEMSGDTILMKEVRNYGPLKKYISRNYPEIYYSSVIMTHFMEEIRNQEGFQVSIGIDSLTYLNFNTFDRVGESLNINQIVGLKSKIGKDLKEFFQIETVGELRDIPPEEIFRYFAKFLKNSDANYITWKIRQKIIGNLPQIKPDNPPIQEHHDHPICG